MMRVAENINGLRVLIGIPVLYLGGTEIQTMTLIRALLSMNAQVTVCCYFDEFDNEMVCQMEDAGAEILLMRLNRNGGLLNLFIKLFRLFREMKPDAVHIRYIAPGLVPLLAARLAGIQKIIATVGQLGNPYGLRPKLFIRMACLLADYTVCTSRPVESSWFGSSAVYSEDMVLPGRKHYTIYNSVDLEQISAAVKSAKVDVLRNQLGLAQNRIMAVIGRLRREKGQVVLLDAMQAVVKAVPDTILLIIGDGPDAERLKEHARRLGISPHVRFVGSLDQNKVFQLFSIIEIIVVPSIHEGFGLVAAEAMAGGVPVVASNVGGLTEIIEDGTSGLLFPVSDIDCLSRQIIKLLHNNELALHITTNATLRANELFSYEAYRKKMVALYKS